MGLFDRAYGRLGLQARMAASYVLVTAAAVIVVELIAIGIVIPSYLAGQDLAKRVTYTAGAEAERVGIASLSSAEVNLPADFTLGQPSSLGPGQVANDGQGLVVPQVGGSLPANGGAMTVAILIGNNGSVLASSYPARYPIGATADSLLPLGMKSLTAGLAGATSDTPAGKVAWAVQMVLIQLSKNRGVVAPGATKPTAPDAYVYVQAPVQAITFPTREDSAPLFRAGLVVLGLALPVGAIFGLLTTRPLVQRLRRLSMTTARVSEGDFDQRVKPRSNDEVGRLERNFNEMAERLTEAVNRERALADKGARQAERNRISRELHDSISQDLFSISLLAAGLEKALPADSQLRPQVRSLVQASEATNREMRALLLELRPASLDEKGLLTALGELVTTYSSRLGLEITSDLESVRLQPAAELAVLRIAQEALANAIRHSHANAITLRLHRNVDRVELVIADDGAGFDPERNGAVEGLGLRLMKERAEEIGGSLTIESNAGRGSVVKASIPGVIE